MRRPLVALALAFAGGIVLQSWIQVPVLLCWLTVAAALLGASVLAVLRLGGPLRFLPWLVALVGLGCIHGVVPPVPEPPPVQGKAVLSGVAQTGWERFAGLRRLVLAATSLREPGASGMPVQATVRLSAYLDPQTTADCPRVLPGDRVLALTRVHLPRSTHNPGGTDNVLMLRRRGIHFTATVSSCQDILVLPEGAGSIRRAIETARNSVLDFIQARESSEAARGVLAALTVGERGLLPDDTRESFQAAGLAHLLAISGLHLGFVALGFFVLLIKILSRFRRLTLGFDVRRLAAGLTIPVTLLYTLLAGAHLPAVRACIMVLCFLIAELIRRRTDPLQIISAAALIILGLWPQTLFEASFLLSFFAVVFIVLGVPVLADWLNLPLMRSGIQETWHRRLRIRLIHFLLTSLTAMLGTAPLVVWFFNRLSPAGLFANLLAVPLGAWVIVPLGLIVVVLLPLSSALAAAVALGALWFSDLLCSLANVIGSWSWASVYVATPSVLQVILSYGILLAACQWTKRPLARWLLVSGGILMAITMALNSLAPLWNDETQVTCIDVGQGDAILVRFPSGVTLLVDGGQAREGGFDAGRRVVAPYLWGQGITRLDFVAITHPQSDHAGGLKSIVSLFRPRQVWSAEPLDARVTAAVAEVAREVGAKIRILRAGDRPYAGEDDDEVTVLWPAESLDGLAENERSLVLRVRHGQRAILLTGDLEKEGEAGLLQSQVDLSADLLKVGHHGGRGASRDEFLEKVAPAYAVISVGAGNPHGLPHPDVLQRLDAAGVRVLRTDQCGAVTAHTDGDELRVNPWVPPAQAHEEKSP